ncbi:MAG: methyltransferase [Bacteroidales bacterium]|nr:methyltransferase [Bacteroidales bacterium]MDD7706679.1 methyltransferase [Bacteroidales bacterium]
MSKDTFHFSQFTIRQDRCAMKVGTDGVLLGAWAEGGRRILDVGCATGVIALMMAQRFPRAEVTGIDIDAETCEQARDNVGASPFAPRVRIACKAIQEWAGAPYDCIVSNPPFFVGSLTSPDTRRTLARHAASLPFDELFGAVCRLLAPEGVFSAIVPTQAEEAFSAEAYIKGLRATRRLLVKTTPRKQPKRVLLAFRRTASPPPPGETFGATANLLNPDASRSDWYGLLTKEFLL